ncbi:MAG: nuclear transport factor 2 family protein [Opitutus sp.]|nr:nuclear transport factor 2 family protein [Opitutus sp.]
MNHLRLLGLLCLATPIAWAAASAAAPVALVLRADQARLAAMTAGDSAALGRVLSEQLVFVHSDGRVEAKAFYVKNLMAGDTAYEGVKTSEVQTMQVAPDVIALLGVQDMRKKLGPAWSDIHLRFLSVWRNESGTWRMVGWQSAKPSGSSIVPPKG